MLSTRRYRLRKRAENAEATRRRILEATMSLHDEKGIFATSLRDIAGRAAVAPSTVLQHFPAMDELIHACGELSDQLAPMPTVAIFVGAGSLLERIRRMAAAMFEWWEMLGPGFDHLRTDRRHIARVDAWLTEVARRHRDLARAALAGADRGRVDLLAALTTPDAWNALRAAGMDPQRAAGHVAQLIGSGQTMKQGCQ